MLNWIVDVSLRYKLLVIIAFGAVGWLGAQAWRDVPVDAFPDVTPNQVNIYTESPGLAAEDVEQLLTFPVESGMAGLPYVEAIRSVSLFGLSYVSVYFKDGVDIYFLRRLVAERLQEVSGRLPTGYGTPELGPNSSGLGQVFWYTVEHADEKLKNGPSDMELRTLQDWSVRLILRTAPGVDDILSWGGQQKQYQVTIDPLKLIRYDLTFRSVMDVIQSNNRQVGGQYIDLDREQFLVRGLGLIADEKELGNIVVKVNNGSPVYLRDVATISAGPAVRFGAVTRDGKEVVFGMALSRVGENAKGVVDAVKSKMDVARKALPEGSTIRPIYDRTELVDKAVETAVRALIEGSVLVAIILLLFLGELRSAVVVISALPFAMLIAFICMQYMGMSANLMSLAGLAIGIGMMIDGAVVMTENAFRIMAERRHANPGRPVDRTRAVLQAAHEVANPVAFAILIIIVVFLPLFSLTGLEGKMFKPMALNISFAMIGSLILTVTLVPVLAAVVLKPKEERDTFLVASIKRVYLPLLHFALRRKGTVFLSAVVLFFASMALFPLLGKEFMPQLQEGSIMWRVTSIPSASLNESIEVSKRIENVLKEKFPEVETTISTIGRAEKGETADVNYQELYTALKPPSEWNTGRTMEKLVADMRVEIEKVAPTTVIGFTQPIQMRVEELISGVRATLAAKVYGEDLATIDKVTNQIKDIIAKVPGAADLSIEANSGKPQVRITVNRDNLARYGLNADEVLSVVRTGIGAEPVSSLIQGVKRFDITVRIDDEAKRDVEAIKAIPLRTAMGQIIPMSAVADVSVAEGYSFIRREDLQRYSIIQMDVRGRDVDSFVKEANKQIAAHIKLPSGYWLEWGGAFENQQRAMAKLAVIVPLTIGLIFILLYTAFNSFRYASMIMANVPFAAIGGMVSLFISRQYLSVPSAIGFIAVFGVAMLNGIVLVSFINDLRDKGLSVTEAVRKGAEMRLRPVMMTASVAILGLVPMLLSSGVGAETQRPLASVVVGGLVTSTLLTLVLLPVIYEWVEARAEKRSREAIAAPDAEAASPAE